MSLYLQDPKTPPGLNFKSFINDVDSTDVSYNSSLRAPRIPFLPAKTLLIFLLFLASKITAEAVVLMTEVTPPD